MEEESLCVRMKTAWEEGLCRMMPTPQVVPFSVKITDVAAQDNVYERRLLQDLISHYLSHLVHY